MGSRRGAMSWCSREAMGTSLSQQTSFPNRLSLLRDAQPSVAGASHDTVVEAALAMNATGNFWQSLRPCRHRHCILIMSFN